jgi:hypothetical protein
MYFEAPWDKSLKAITTAVTAFLIVEVIGISIALYLTTTGRMAFLVTVLVVVCNTLIIGFTSLYAPQGYLVDDSGITIIRKRAPVHIGFGSIRHISRIERNRFMKSLRTFGNGGLFGYYGSFRNKELGNFRMYATHGDCGVLIQTDKTFVITPDRADEFIEVVRSYLP